MLQMQKLIVCSSGQYQHQTQQTACIDCPAGTARATHNNDDDPWDGGTNNNVADAKADCIVCSSGQYQHETQQTAIRKDCPAGTARATHNNDDDPWDGGTNMNVADSKANGIVCSSGQYQHETQQTACIDCPSGTVRYSDNVDGTSLE